MQLTGGTIAVVATGEMGSAVAATLLAAGLQVVTSLDGRSQRTRELAVAAGVPDVGSLAAVVREVRVFLSIVPTAAARPLAEAVAGVLPAATAGGFTYVDCNATSPQTAAGIGRLIEAAGARFVDASIIGSPPRGGPPVSIWLAGEHAGEVRAMLACAGIDPQVAGGEVGQASAVKMCYAAITKGLAALATESFTAAARAGLAEHVESSLLRHQPGLLALVTDMVTGAPPKAHRWVAEMEEIAATMAATGLPAASFTGAAQLYALVAATALGAETPEGRQQRSLGAVAAELASHTARDQ